MAIPVFDGQGTGVTDAGGAWAYTCTVNGTPAAGRVHVVNILQDGTTSGAITSVVGTNIENLAGTDNVWTEVAVNQPVGSPTAGLQHVYIGRALSTSAPTISGANSTSEDLYIIDFAYNNVSTGTTLATVIENGSAGATANGVGTSNSLLDTAVTTLGVDRLALNCVAVTDDTMGVNQFTGESGGTWRTTGIFESATGTDGTIGQTNADMVSAGTINGGSDGLLASIAWGVVGFALIGTTVESTFSSKQAKPVPFVYMRKNR